MTTRLILDNLVTYSLQIGLLIALGACVTELLRLRQPGAKLVYWQIVLTVCLLLPLQPWKQAVTTASLQVAAAPVATLDLPAVPVPSPQRSVPRSQIVLMAVLAGVAIRLACLSVGLWKLRRYRRRALPLVPQPTWGVEAAVLLSEDVTSPVTFGFRQPAVLLPANFPDMHAVVQDAILCHEILHVRRKDWLVTVTEEIVRAVFWFHPAIWWLLGEICLAREQEVDRLAIEITHQREEYMDALMTIASARAQLDLAPAPLFLRKRHLKHRMVMILKESRMSKKQIVSTFVTSLAMLAGVCWMVTGAMPLVAQPQVVYDAPGVTVNLGGAPLMHRSAVTYPAAAVQKRAQGALSLEVKLDASGNVSDARVLSGPDELRRSALESVLQWHFGRELAGTTRIIGINYELPRQPELPVKRSDLAVRESVTVTTTRDAAPGVLGGIIGSVPSTAPGTFQNRSAQLQAALNGPIMSIRITGLPDAARADLLSRLPIHEGETLSSEGLDQVTRVVKSFDEHMTVQRSLGGSPGGDPELVLAISAPPVAGPRPAMTDLPSRIKVGTDTQAAMILNKVQPAYPPIAKSARVQGVVQLAAVIGKEGTIKELHAVAGPPLLIQAAMDAVKQWRYKPTLLNGEAVEVDTTIAVGFQILEQ